MHDCLIGFHKCHYTFELTFILLCEIVIWLFYIYFQFSSYVLVIFQYFNLKKKKEKFVLGKSLISNINSIKSNSYIKNNIWPLNAATDQSQSSILETCNKVEEMLLHATAQTTFPMIPCDSLGQIEFGEVLEGTHWRRHTLQLVVIQEENFQRIPQDYRKLNGTNCKNRARGDEKLTETTWCRVKIPAD